MQICSRNGLFRALTGYIKLLSRETLNQHTIYFIMVTDFKLSFLKSTFSYKIKLK